MSSRAHMSLALGVVVGLLAWPALGSAAEKLPGDKVDFLHDVKPIFAKHCYSCHGEDSAEGSLRLDRRADALRGGNSGPAFEAGKSDDSRMVAYIKNISDDGMVMPPEGEPLSETEIALISTWIDQGANWPDDKEVAKAAASHWSLQPVTKPEVPAVANAAWVRNPIDAFILARLDKLGIEPSPEADRETLIRRLSLDLLGLPPGPADVEEFLRDKSPDAYEKLVDRLLASPHYGERWGRHWLDMARYADSDGYEKDTSRPYAWRYRNWVINAINRDLPFDEFTIEQLAGDLIDGGDLEQRVATGFHRNTLTNREGGVDQEEFRVSATIDRVNTTGTVWLGLTVGCTQCHSHKYDPLTQREYYELFAFFNSVDEQNIPAPLPEQEAEYERLRVKFDVDHDPLLKAVADYEAKELLPLEAKWEAALDRSADTQWQIVTPSDLMSSGKLTLKAQPDRSIRVLGDGSDVATYTITAPTDVKMLTGIRLEALTDDALPKRGPGLAYSGNFVVSELKVSIVTPDVFAAEAFKKKQGVVTKKEKPKGPQPIRVALRHVEVDHAQDKFNAERMIDDDLKTGWAVAPQVGKDHVATFETDEPVEIPAGSQVRIEIVQERGNVHLLGKFRLAVTGSNAPLRANGIDHGIAAALDVERDKRNEDEQRIVTTYFSKLDDGWKKLNEIVEKHDSEAPEDPGVKTKAQTLVELREPRKTHVLVRGDFLRPGAEVERATFAVLPPLAAEHSPPTRLDLAHWLVSPDNPLTSRVTVNRVWAKHFGRGIVATVDDFGSQGERPSHPELLDWLARWFVEDGWSMKRLHKLIVTSATYRQRSDSRPDLVDRDPGNILLARQTRLRVEAEVVRDLALAAGGLLTREIGGPSVKPPQPEGVAAITYNNSNKWVESTGADRYRRGMYTHFQRTSPYPMLMTFDAPDSNITCVRRERSNTPLQALTVLNDPTFVECAQALGRRVMAESPAVDKSDVPARMKYLVRVCLARDPEPAELDNLVALYQDELKYCQDEPTAEQVAGLAAKDVPKGATLSELAAWTLVGRTIMNLDEFIVRE